MRRHRPDLVVVGERVVDATLVESEVGEPDRPDRPSLGFGSVTEQHGGTLARRTVADCRRAQHHHGRGHRCQFGRVVALGEADRLGRRSHRRRERPAVLHDADGAEHADQRAHGAPRPQVVLEAGEQRIGLRRAAQETQRGREDLGQEQGVGR